MYEIKNRGEVVFTNAYIINGASGGPKIDQVLNAIDKCYKASDRQATQYVVPDSLQRTAEALHSLPGVGDFIAGQVVADLRWVLGDVEQGWWTDRMTLGPTRARQQSRHEVPAGHGDGGTHGWARQRSDRQAVPALPAPVGQARPEHPTVGKVFKDGKRKSSTTSRAPLRETSKYIRIKYGTGKASIGYDPMGRYNSGQLDMDTDRGRLP